MTPPDNPFFDMHLRAHELAKKVTHKFYVRAPDDEQVRERWLTDADVKELRDLGFYISE